MYNKKVKLRALFLFLSIASIILVIFLVLKALEDNVVYFLSPTEIKNLNETTIHSTMLVPLGIMTAAFALFSLLIFLMKYNTELIKIKNKGLDRL